MCGRSRGIGELNGSKLNHNYVPSLVTISTFTDTLHLHHPEPERLLTFNRTTTTQHFYFNRVVRLWNKLPSNIVDLSLSLTCNTQNTHAINIYGPISSLLSILTECVLSNLCAHALTVCKSDNHASQSSRK